jgi:outer membrane protein assembly factor BamB
MNAPGGIVVGGDGTIYVGGRYSFFAIGPDGQQKWAFPGPDRNYEWGGTPALTQDLVLATFMSTLYALNRANGQVVWTRGAGGFVSVSQNILRMAAGGASVDAYTLTGGYLWSLAMTNPAGPAVDGAGNAFVSVPSALRSITPSGSAGWSLSTTAESLRVPVVGADGTVYQAGRGTLRAVSPSGTLLWTVSLTGDVSQPSVAADGTLYVSTGPGVVAIRPDSSIAWSYPWPKANGYATAGVTIGRDGTVYAVSSPGRVIALDPAGNLLWDYQLPDAGYQRPVLGPDGTLYVAVNIQMVVALSP